jgi:hypothetical protein
VAVNIWVILLIGIVVLFGSFVFVAGIYILITKLIDWLRDRKLPPKEKMLIPENKPYVKSGKEVEEDEKIRNRKLREFEKLRTLIRTGEQGFKADERELKPSTQPIYYDEQFKGRGPVSLSTPTEPTADRRTTKGNESNSNKRIKLTE